jgi:hypothetical protein
VKEGGGAEGECERERALELLLDATALDIEVDPQRCCFGSRQSGGANFALQAVVECRARLNRSASELLVCDDIPAAMKCASVSRWACRKRRRQKLPCILAVTSTVGGNLLPESLSGPCRCLRYHELTTHKVTKSQSACGFRY